MYLGKSNNSVRTSWKNGKTFLEDRYLKDIKYTSDDKHFYFRFLEKNEDPPALQLALYEEKLSNQHVHAWQGKWATVTML